MKNQGNWPRNALASRIALAVAGLCCASSVLAVEPAALRLGPLNIEPTLDVDAAYTDNLYRVDRGEIGSWIIKTTPELNTWLQRGTNTYGLRYELQDFRYSGTPSGEDDDFTDHRFRSDVHHEFNAKNLLDVYAQHDITHEQRGTGLTEGLFSRFTDKPIEYDHSLYGAIYTYGNRQTNSAIEFSIEGQEYEYQNFRQSAQYYDYDKLGGTGTFYWNLSARTALVAEASFTEIDYERQDERIGIPGLDADEWQLLLGATWEASAKTRGTVKLGGYRREFDDNRRDTGEGFSWDVHLNYRPKTYSIYDFSTRQITRETNGAGDYIDSRELQFDWLHMFPRGYRSNVSMLLADDNYRENDRDDLRLLLEWYVDRPFKRWLDIGVGWRYEDRDSSEGVYSYQRQALFARLKVSL